MNSSNLCNASLILFSTLFFTRVFTAEVEDGDEIDLSQDEPEQESQEEQQETVNFKQVNLKNSQVVGIQTKYKGITTETPLSIYQIFKFITKSLKGRALSLLDKENKDLLHQAINSFINKVKIKRIIGVMPDTLKSQKRISIDDLAKSELWNALLQINDEDKANVRDKLGEGMRTGVSLTYALINKAEQARSIIDFVNLNVKDHSITHSTRDSFVEVASEYSKIEVIDYLLPNEYLGYTLGPEIIDEVAKVNEGNCNVEPIYLSKERKWIVFHIDKKQDINYSDNDIEHLALQEKRRDLIQDKINELKQSGQFKVLNKNFYEELDSDADTNRVLIQIGPKLLTVASLKHGIELLFPKTNADDLIRYYKQTNPAYGKELCNQAIDYVAKIMIISILAEEEDLVEKNPDLYNEFKESLEYNDNESVLYTIMRSKVSDKDVMNEFNKLMSSSEFQGIIGEDTKVKGIYVVVKSKDILDRLKLRISSFKSKNTTPGQMESLMTQLVSDYSIYADSTLDDKVKQSKTMKIKTDDRAHFDDRRYRLEKTLGAFYDLVNGEKAGEIKSDSVYTATYPDKGLYALIYVTEVYKEDVTLAEYKKFIVDRLTKRQIDLELREVTANISPNKLTNK